MQTNISFELDAQLVSQLLDILFREQASLVTLDVDALEVLLEEKSVLLERITDAAKMRYDMLNLDGLAQSEIGMELWVNQQGKLTVKSAWLDFQKSLNQAKEMNRLNGMLINQHFNRNQVLINHLQGNSDALMFMAEMASHKCNLHCAQV